MMLNAETLRFKRVSGTHVQIGKSPNRGMECYLGEAYCKIFPNNDPHKSAVLASQKRVVSEARNLDGKQVWGWEKSPSVPGICFPADWDDTAKAIDFLKSAQAFLGTPATRGIPDANFWCDWMKASLFESRTFGTDALFPAKSRRALNVFFGPGSETLSPRDDPMVTVATIRTTALWFPEVISSLPVEDLMRRGSEVIKTSIDREVPFAALSRYYFSLGHYLFRFIETLSFCGMCLSDVGLKMTELVDQSLVRSKRPPFPSHFAYAREPYWWQLIGILLGSIRARSVLSPEFFQCGDSGPEIVYRHRRLGHYYGASRWTLRLQLWELVQAARSSSMMLETVAV